MTWSETIATLTAARTLAESCVALLKRYGNEAQRANGQLTYAKAKSDADAAIAGLITALGTGDEPGNLPFLQTRLTSSATNLAEFAEWVNNIVSALMPSGQRDVLSALAKNIGIEALVKAISDGLAALYQNHRSDDALKRKMIQTQLEGAIWPDFAKVAPAQ
jgi:hypothetical protein